MPKISNNNVTTITPDGRKNFDVEIFYNSKNHFYAVVPEVLNSQFDHLSEIEKKELHTEKYFKKRGDDLFKRIVTGSTERECFERIKSIIDKLIVSTISKRNVIIVFYYPEKGSSYSGHKYNKEHRLIGMNFALCYAIETCIAGGKPIYNIYSEYEAFGKKNTNRNELNLWSEKYSIINDTPESRLFLELLYKNLDSLINKLEEFTSTPEKLISFISSNQKLIS
jgi:hypothetical protein